MSYESKDQIFIYHAYGLGLGGYIERNWQMLPIPSIGSSALSSAGGIACSQSGFFEWAPPCEPPGGFYISTASVTSRLWTSEDDDYWTSEAEIQVAGFNLCNRVKVGLMINRMTSQHKKRKSRSYDEKRDHQPRITFKDSQFWNVTIDGEPLDVTINRGLDEHATHDELKTLISDDQTNGGQFCRHSLLACHDSNDTPQYVKDLVQRYRSDKISRCSVVNDIPQPNNGKFKVHGYSVDIPDFGRIFFGEMMVSDGMKRLNMIRWDLGCENCGGGTGGSSDMNGVPMP